MLTPEAIALLEEVKVAITQHADHFDMNHWFAKGHGEEWLCFLDIFVEKTVQDYDIKDCGTTACIAGWIVLLRQEEAMKIASVLSYPCTVKVALGMLGINCDHLFYLNYWSSDLISAYYKAESSKDKAKIACLAIDQFIESQEDKVS